MCYNQCNKPTLMTKTFTERQARELINDTITEVIDVLARNMAQLEKMEKELRFDNLTTSDRVKLAGQRELLLKLKREIIPLRTLPIRVTDDD